METLAQRLLGVRAGIAATAEQAGRDPAGVTLVAVSKFQPAEAIAAALAAGQRDFGENHAQELRDKSQLLGDAIRWHFIGPLQRNKVRLVTGRACLIHSVDSLPLLQAIIQRCQRPAEPVRQDCLVEVNIAAEPQKSGCSLSDLPALLDTFAAAGGAVRCLGLMCIPPAADDPEQSRPHFRRLRELLEEAARVPRPHVELRELSMGMSHDYPVAIAEGATLVRVGTAIFGPRPS